MAERPVLTPIGWVVPLLIKTLLAIVKLPENCNAPFGFLLLSSVMEVEPAALALPRISGPRWTFSVPNNPVLLPLRVIAPLFCPEAPPRKNQTVDAPPPLTVPLKMVELLFGVSRLILPVTAPSETLLARATAVPVMVRPAPAVGKDSDAALVPRLPAAAMLKIPPATEIGPVRVFAALLRVRVPLSVLVSVPAPLTTPLSVSVAEPYTRAVPPLAVMEIAREMVFVTSPKSPPPSSWIVLAAAPKFESAVPVVKNPEVILMLAVNVLTPDNITPLPVLPPPLAVISPLEAMVSKLPVGDPAMIALIVVVEPDASAEVVIVAPPPAKLRILGLVPAIV